MVAEAYCPWCKEDYNTLTPTTVKCMNCFRTYPIEEWRMECDKARVKERNNERKNLHGLA